MRYVFHSFHYSQDSHRAALVRNVGAIEGNRSAQPNEWQELQRQGTTAIARWIEQQLEGRTCTVVLIGEYTATRPWVIHEIRRSWALRLGVLGVHIHNLKNMQGLQSNKGSNPFAQVANLEVLAPVYDPPFFDSQQTYRYIANHTEGWIENAIRIRSLYP